MQTIQKAPNSPTPIPIANPSSSSGSITIIGKQKKEQQQQQVEMKMRMEKDKREREKMMMMRQYVRKLALWYTRNFTPILSHDQLQPIMATLGFFPLPLISTSSPPPPPPNSNSNSNSNSVPVPVPVLWKEYYYCNYSPGPLLHRNSSSDSESKVPPPPRPRLPYPNIDGLHFFTYRAFLDALNFYLPPFSNLSDIFHLRGMPLQREDQNKVWHSMYENDLKFVHCEASFNSSACKNEIKNRIESNSKNIRNKGELTPFGIFVPLDDIITRPTQLKKRK